VIDPEPAVVPVNVTEHVPAESVQVVALNEPPVLPGVRVKVTVPVGVFVEVVVSVTVATTLAVQLVPPNAIVQLTFGTEVEVLSFAATVTVMVAGALVLVLWVVSPPYAAVIEPEPAVVPVNITEQLPDESIQVVALNKPPVVPAVRVKVTVPVGVFAGVVVSATVATTLAVQLVPPNAMLQLTFPTLVDELSLAVTVTLTLVVDPEAVAPTGLPLITRVNGPVGVADVVEIVKTSVAPAKVGVTVAEAKLQLTPIGRGVTQDRVTAREDPAFKVAVIVTALELP
jgi:hypothetical protein